VPPPGLPFGSVRSTVPGPLWAGSFVTALPEGVVVLPVLERCSRLQRALAEPVIESQSVVTVAPVVALPVVLPVEPLIALPLLAAGLDWVLAVS
jgi:hypothetical protein